MALRAGALVLGAGLLALFALGLPAPLAALALALLGACSLYGLSQLGSCKPLFVANPLLWLSLFALFSGALSLAEPLGLGRGLFALGALGVAATALWALLACLSLKRPLFAALFGAASAPLLLLFAPLLPQGSPGLALAGALLCLLGFSRSSGP